MTNTLTLGKAAPDFSLPADGGETISLSSLKGKWVVLYFYPRDDTPGCTKEAIAFTDHIKAFDTHNAIILGVSKDTVAKHDKFKAKHDLKVTLLSDEEGAIIESYGVWVEKNMYGKKYMGIQRATILIDPEGNVAHIWPKVKVKEHAEDVLSVLGDLQNP